MGPQEVTGAPHDPSRLKYVPIIQDSINIQELLALLETEYEANPMSSATTRVCNLHVFSLLQFMRLLTRWQTGEEDR